MDPFAPIPGGTAGPVATEFEIDLPTSEEMGQKIPIGKYLAKVVSVVKGFSKSSGAPMWTWTYVVVDGPNAGFELIDYTVLSPAAMWKVVQVLEALGLGKPGEKVAFKAVDALNRLCALDVVDDEYQGVKKSKIKTISAPPQGVGTLHTGMAGGTPI